MIWGKKIHIRIISEVQSFASNFQTVSVVYIGFNFQYTPLADPCCHGNQVQPLTCVVGFFVLIKYVMISIVLQDSSCPSPHIDDDSKKKKEDLKVNKRNYTLCVCEREYLNKSV